MNSIITDVYYITNKTELSRKYSGNNKKISRGSSISQGRRLVDHKSSIPQKNRHYHSHMLPIRDIYPNNKNKQAVHVVLNKCNMGFMRLKRLYTGLTAFSF